LHDFDQQRYQCDLQLVISKDYGLIGMRVEGYKKQNGINNKSHSKRMAFKNTQLKKFRVLKCFY